MCNIRGMHLTCWVSSSILNSLCHPCIWRVSCWVVLPNCLMRTGCHLLHTTNLIWRTVLKSMSVRWLRLHWTWWPCIHWGPHFCWTNSVMGWDMTVTSRRESWGNKITGKFCPVAKYTVIHNTGFHEQTGHLPCENFNHGFTANSMGQYFRCFIRAMVLHVLTPWKVARHAGKEWRKNLIC